MSRQDSPRHEIADAQPALAAHLAGWAEALVTKLDGQIDGAESRQLLQQARALSEQPVRPAPPQHDPTRPTVIRDPADLLDMKSKLDAADAIGFDLETTDFRPDRGVIVGAGFAVDDASFYVPINHRDEDTHELQLGQVPLVDVVKTLKLDTLPLVAHNAKFEFKWMRRHGGVTCTFKWDTMLAARLLRSDLSAELKQLAPRELDVPDWSLTKDQMVRIQTLPIDTVAGYCATDCVYTLALFRRQHSCLS